MNRVNNDARRMKKMSKGGLVVFAEVDHEELLREIRRTDARFKRARIQDVLQCRPDLIKEGIPAEETHA